MEYSFGFLRKPRYNKRKKRSGRFYKIRSTAVYFKGFWAGRGEPFFLKKGLPAKKLIFLKKTKAIVKRSRLCYNK